MPRKKKVKQVTVPELQAFLKGAMEFNPDDWVPDAAQWKRIVEMVMNLKPEETQIVVQNNTGKPLSESVERVVDNSSVDESVEDSNLITGAPKVNMRRNNVERTNNMSGKDGDGVIKSGQQFKTANRDDSEGITPSEFA